MRSLTQTILAALMLVQSIANAQSNRENPSGIEPTSSQAAVAAELANPLAPVTTFVAQFRTEFGNGPDDDTNYQLRLQPSLFKPLSDGSALLLRTVFPFRFTQWPTDASGLGDISLIPYYVPDTSKSTFVGFGGVLNIPTATPSSLGSGKWSAGPALIVAKTGQPIVYGGLAQQVWSFAGQPDRGSVSVTTIQPFITYLVGGGWAIGANTETTYNWNASSGQRWTVPISASVSKVVKFGDNFVNLGFAYVTYAARPDYAPEWEFRFNAQYVFR
jgi:hypothetical protein